MLARALEELEAAHLRRRLRPEPGKLADFASNDYLGLRRHPAVVAAAGDAGREAGAGAGASRLITGTDAAVLGLESRLAAWKEKEAALVFGSGYAAAVGTIPALVGRGDTVFLDKLAHASLIDGARLSGATVRVFPHNQLGRLERLLAGAGTGRKLIVSESLFSMDGDAAPLAGLVEAKERHGAWLLIDEAHATGLYGPARAGLVAEAGLSARVEIVMGTLSKALGGVGGYIAGSRVLIDWLVNRARSFIYSTALPPGAIAAAQAAIGIAADAEGEALRRRLAENIARFRSAAATLPWKITPAAGAIQPVLCGDAETALRLAGRLEEAGFRVPAIRYPTVARHAARLRVTLSARHTGAEIDGLVAALCSGGL